MDDLLHQSARYYFRDSRTSRVEVLEYEEAARRKMRCRGGVLELFAQTVTLMWNEGREARRESIVVPPLFTKDQKASTELAAIDAAVPELDYDSFFKLSSVVGLVVHVLSCDSAKSNIRLLNCLAVEARRHNQLNADRGCHGRVLLWTVLCISHILTRAVSGAFVYSSFIATLYSVAFVHRFPPRANLTLSVLRSKVEASLQDGGYIPGGECSEADAQHTRMMLSLLLCRPLRTKGRSALEPGRREDDLRDLLDRLCAMLTGDIRVSTVAHVCSGCCDSAGTAAAKITSLLDEAFTSRMGHALPSTNKFWTFEPSMVAQGGLWLIHGLAKQVLPRSLGSHNSDQENSDDDDFRKRVSRKVRKAKAAADDVNHALQLAAALWATEPLDKLSAVMQHGDINAGSSLQYACYSRGSVWDCEVDLCRRVADKGFAFSSSLLVRHFEREADLDDGGGWVTRIGCGVTVLVRQGAGVVRGDLRQASGTN